MSCVDDIPDHADRAVQRLISYFRFQPNIIASVRAFVDPMQRVEETLSDLCDKRLVAADAEGVQLDRLGDIVGAVRAGRSDAAMRSLILAHIYINTSQGVPENLITLFNLLTGSTKTHLLLYYPFVAELYANVDLTGQDNEDTLRLCRLILPSATLLTHIVSYADSDAFAFDGPNPGKGWGTVTDPDVGGKFAWIAA